MEEDVNKGNRNSVERHISWKFAAEGWYNLNTHGAFMQTIGRATKGDILHNSYGGWEEGFMQNIRTCTTL